MQGTILVPYQQLKWDKGVAIIKASVPQGLKINCCKVRHVWENRADYKLKVTKWEETFVNAFDNMIEIRIEEN